MADLSQPPPHRYINTENIRAGDVILEEEAWFWIFLNVGRAKLVCNYCFKVSDKLKSCSACKSAFYCDATCQRKDWRFRHKHEECKYLKELHETRQERLFPVTPNFPHEEMHLSTLILRLLLSAASARLFHASERNRNGNPTTPLWNTFMHTPYEADLADLSDWQEKVTSSLLSFIRHRDTPASILRKRLLPSLVLLGNREPLKKALKGLPYTKEVLQPTRYLALGACMEMAKYPNSCDRPNAITINDGKLVRMVAMEDIENLDQIRLARFPVWLHKSRYQRRILNIHKYFGYGCWCSRCIAGDTAAETTLFALRCPKWAKHYPLTNKEQACNGIVKGLRRTDFSSAGTNDMTGEMEPDLDEPLSYRAVNAPLHERAVCMQCNAKYDAATIKNEILPLLKNMEKMRESLQNSLFIAVGQRTDYWVDTVLKAEKFVYPTNYVYLAAKRMLIPCIMDAVQEGSPVLYAEVAVWLKNYVREVLARVEAVGCQQMDMLGLEEIAGTYGHYVEVARNSSSREGGGGLSLAVDAETRELMHKTAMCATKKLKLLLQMRDE